MTTRLHGAAGTALWLCFACTNTVGDGVDDVTPRDDVVEASEGEGEPAAPGEGEGEPAAPGEGEGEGELDEPPVDVEPEPPSNEYVPPNLPACVDGPLHAPLGNCEPQLLPSTGAFHQDCVNRINQFRWECQCLGPLARWTDGEPCADRMAESDHDSGQAHGASSQGLCDWGFAQNECPGWNDPQQCVEGCLQMMWDEGPGSFFGGHGHYINMSSTEHSQVACGVFAGNNGAWSVQNFR